MNNGIYKLSDDGKTLLGVTDKNISEAVIPDGVTHIEENALFLCSSLRSIVIPDSVTHIGDSVFCLCSALQSIEVAEGNQYLASIDGVLFNKDLTQIIRYPEAKNSKQYIIPDSVTHIGDSAFSGCEALQSIDIPNSVTHIGDYAFYWCKALQSIDIPNSVTHIGKEAFSGCKALQSIVIPNSVTHIGDSAFSGCWAQSINIPNSVTHIGNKAFYYCKALQSIDIPNSVTHIGDEVFSWCSSLQSIDIPNSVTHIGDRVFSECKSLQSIEVAEDNQYFASIDGVLFSNDLTQIIRYPEAKNGNQYTIPNSVTHIGNYAFSRCKALQSIDIPNSVTHIGDEAFLWCETLQSIDIPNSVTHIGDRAFSGCIALQSIEVVEDNQYFASIDGVLFSNDLTQIIRYPEAKNGNQYTIPNSVTHIGNEAFCGCNALQSIHIRITDIDSCSVKENAFDYIDFDNCILYIPSGTRWAYRHHPVFRRFKNIEIERIK